MKIVLSLIFLIFSLLVFIYIKISQPNIKILNKDRIYVSEKKEEKFLKFSSFNYKLPVRILYEKIDFKKVKTVLLYKVTIKNNDKFAIFNIIEILKSKKIPYSIIKKKKTEIYIVFKSLKEAEEVLNLFKFYNFPVKLQKIIKRI